MIRLTADARCHVHCAFSLRLSRQLSDTYAFHVIFMYLFGPKPVNPFYDDIYLLLAYTTHKRMCAFTTMTYPPRTLEGFRIW